MPNVSFILKMLGKKIAIKLNVVYFKSVFFKDMLLSPLGISLSDQQVWLGITKSANLMCSGASGCLASSPPGSIIWSDGSSFEGGSWWSGITFDFSQVGAEWAALQPNGAGVVAKPNTAKGDVICQCASRK